MAKRPIRREWRRCETCNEVGYCRELVGTVWICFQCMGMCPYPQVETTQWTSYHWGGCVNCGRKTYIVTMLRAETMSNADLFRLGVCNQCGAL